jgi:hypothetical protein
MQRRRRIYIDETVMKEEAKERSTKAAFFWNRILNHRFHDAKDVGTTFRIKTGGELMSRGAPRENHQKSYCDYD